MRLPVILVTLPIQIERQLGDLLIGQVGVTGIENHSAGRFLGAGSGGLLHACLNRVQLRIDVAIATNAPGVEHAHRRDRLEALVGLCCRQRVSPAAADAEQSQTFNIDARILRDEIGHAVDVLDAVRGLVHAARLATACTLVGGIGGDGDVALFGQVLGIEARDLFLHAAVRVRHDDGGIFPALVVTRRRIDVRGNIQPMQLVADWVDVDLARLVRGDRAAIDGGKVTYSGVVHLIVPFTFKACSEAGHLQDGLGQAFALRRDCLIVARASPSPAPACAVPDRPRARTARQASLAVRVRRRRSGCCRCRNRRG